MPIYADTVPFGEMLKLERYHVCAECGDLLRLSWSNERNCYILRCARFEHHEGVRRLDRDPGIMEIRNKLKGEPLPMSTQEAKQQTMTKMLARVDQARFPKDLVPAERQLIATVAIEYGLDPLFSELMLYQGKPYVTIDARRRKAQETGNLDGISARPATTAERKARLAADGDYLFVAEVWVKGASHAFEGWGRVTQLEVTRAIAQAKAHGKQEDALPLVKDPVAMAEKRAEAQALRRAFHLPLPSFEEIVEGEFEILTPKSDTPESKSSLLKPPANSQRAATLTTESKTEVEGEGFHIDNEFLEESLKALKWTENTCKTFIVSKYKVSPEGTLAEVLQRLTREQAEEFVKEISERVTQKAQSPRMI